MIEYLVQHPESGTDEVISKSLEINDKKMESNSNSTESIVNNDRGCTDVCYKPSVTKKHL